MVNVSPDTDNDDTEEVVSPCPWCGSSATRLVDCDPPPFRVLGDGCIYSGERDDPRWRWCGRGTPRRFTARF